MNCYATGNINVVSGCSYGVAGLVGYAAESTISDCYSDVNITIGAYSDGGMFGGLVTILDGGTVRNSEYNGKILIYDSLTASDSYIGGILGRTSTDKSSTITNTNMNGTIQCIGTGDYLHVGLILGYGQGDNDTVSNCNYNPALQFVLQVSMIIL